MSKVDATFVAARSRLTLFAALLLLLPCVVCQGADELSRGRPVLELLFEGNLSDTSDGKRESQAKGTIGFVDGKRGKCVSFDSQSWIDTGFSQDQLGQEFTVECWVNPADRQSPHADIFGNHVSDGKGFVLQQDGTATNHFLAAYGAGRDRWVMTDPAALMPGRWQHVALVKTQEELRLYQNGVLVATKEERAPALVSPMPVAVGLGYTDEGRCFRGLIDEFRIWDVALDDFGHAGIDPASAEETLAQCLHSKPRPTASEVTRSWMVTTDDTFMELGVTASGELVVRELACLAAGWNWIANPVAIRLWSRAEVGGRSVPLRWRYVETDVDESDERKATFQFVCDEAALEVTSVWYGGEGSGPIRHTMQLKNLSEQPVTIGEQPTFDLDLTGADTMWCFHSDGLTPDPVGVYRHPLSGDNAVKRHTIRTFPMGGFIPYVVLDADQAHGLYLGLEWSFCKIETVALDGESLPAVRVRGGNTADIRETLAPGEILAIRPGFVGTYCGDLDDAGNCLRRWLFQHCVPPVLREDASYPKVQWNAFGATGKAPGSWDPVESKFYPFIDDITPLGFEEVMIDVGWWEGGEPDSDRVDWSSGMRKAADYAHAKGLRFGLYWTDDLDMASSEGRRRRADRIRRLFEEYDADMWRSDCTRGEVIGSSYAATCGFYQMVDMLAREIPGFQWENCSGGGRIKDYGAMRRAVKIFNSDTYSALHVRQAFYDSSFAFHPIQLEGHLGSTDGRYRPRGVKEMRYAFRSTSMGAPEWFLDAPNGGNGSGPWSQEEKDALKACVETYKTRIRPLIRSADLYHILPRPDGRRRDGIEYYDPVDGRGVVYLFQPSNEVSAEPVRFKGLDADREYRVIFEDGRHPTCVRLGRELMEVGLSVTMEGPEASELMFFEAVKQAQ